MTVTLTARSDLLAILSDVGAATEIERRKKQGAVGWLGYERMTIEVDYQFILDLGGTAEQVIVHRGSPLWDARVRTGDFIVSASTSPISDVPLVEFEALQLPAGTEVFVKFCRPGRGKTREITITTARLRARPIAKLMASWKLRPPVDYGLSLERKDRSRFEADMATNPYLTHLGFRVLVRLLRYYDKPGHGSWPSYQTIARDLRCSRRAAINQVARLERIGILRVKGRVAQAIAPTDFIFTGRMVGRRNVTALTR